MNRFNPLLLLLIFAAGCAPLQKKSDLEAVHEAYRADFSASFVADAKTGGQAQCEGKASFQRSLQAIQDYEAVYAGDTSVAAERNHLRILKGMIHLQLGNTGIARSMTEDVQKAVIPVADDRAVRDELFRRAYPALVDGWEEICDSIREKKLGPYSIENEAERQRKTKQLRDAAAAVAAVARPKEAAKGANADEGALYLAGTSAVFSYWAFRIEVDSCVRANFADRNAPTTCRNAAKGLLQNALAALTPSFTESEKKGLGLVTLTGSEAKDGAQGWERSVAPNRRPYIRLYDYLRKEAAI